MAGRSPFFLSALMSAGIVLGILFRIDRRPVPPAPRPPPMPTPYIDSHWSVPHAADLAATSMNFGLRWLERHQSPDGAWRAGAYVDS